MSVVRSQATPWHRSYNTMASHRSRQNAEGRLLFWACTKQTPSLGVLIRAPYCRHSSAVIFPTMMRERRDCAVRSQCERFGCVYNVHVVLIRRLSGVLCDATARLPCLNSASTTLMGSVICIPRRSYNDCTELSWRSHRSATALLAIVLRSPRRSKIVRKTECTQWKRREIAVILQ